MGGLSPIQVRDLLVRLSSDANKYRIARRPPAKRFVRAVGKDVGLHGQRKPVGAAQISRVLGDYAPRVRSRGGQPKVGADGQAEDSDARWGRRLNGQDTSLHAQSVNDAVIGVI